MNYCEGINFITSQGRFRVELGLDRISKALNLLGNPQENLKCIHVAGTNGKGSTCAIVSAILKEYGLKVGLYTSPHIFEYTERIKINDVEISKDDFAKYLDEVVNITKGIDLTEFELITIVMFKYFADNNVDVVVLETGMGGRFDATNVIKSNLCSIICHIDFDHTDKLGNTLEQIAYEKAGIIKENCPVITSNGFEVLYDEAMKKNSSLIIVSPQADISNLSLKGLCQKENLSLALACINQIFPQISNEIIQNALKKVNHPFRFQYFKDKNLIVDSAHNPNGIDELCRNLEYYFPNTKKQVVFGCLKRKDYKSMIEKLKCYDLYYYHFDYPDSAEILELREVYEADEFKGQLDKDVLTVVCGSFYMLKEVLEYFK